MRLGTVRQRGDADVLTADLRPGTQGIEGSHDAIVPSLLVLPPVVEGSKQTERAAVAAAHAAARMITRIIL